MTGSDRDGCTNPFLRHGCAGFPAKLVRNDVDGFEYLSLRSLCGVVDQFKFRDPADRHVAIESASIESGLGGKSVAPARTPTKRSRKARNTALWAAKLVMLCSVD